MHKDYMEYGNMEGPLLVFIHGGGVGGWMWDKQIAYFKDYHCLVPTLQGHGGRSDETTFSIRGKCIEIIELIEQKKMKRTYISLVFRSELKSVWTCFPCPECYKVSCHQ